MRQSLRRVPIYILLIVCLQLNSCDLNWRRHSILSLAAPFNMLNQEDYDYINNESANTADDDGEAINEFLNVNLPHMNMEAVAVPPLEDSHLKMSALPLFKDEEQQQNSIVPYDLQLQQQLERNKLSTAQNRPTTENKMANTFYDDGNGNTIGVEMGAGTGTPGVGANGNSNANDHKELADEQQEIIDHVTNLIRSMREHAIGIIKDMNDLEMDFLYSTGGNGNGNPDTGDNKNCNDMNFGNGYNQEISTTSPISNSLCNDFNATPMPPTTNNCFNTSNSNKWSNSNSNSNSKHNCNSNNNNNVDNSGNNNNNNNEKKMNTPNYFVNEWSAPMTSTNPGVDAKEFMQQAHEAVKSWREQIEACKQILDAAVAQATQSRHATNGVFNGGSEPTPNSLAKNNDVDSMPYSAERTINSGANSLNNNKMKKQSNILPMQHNENIAQNYDALINTLRARGVPNVWDFPPLR